VEGQPRLPGRWPVGDYAKVRDVARGARDYARSQGFDYKAAREFAGVRADPNNIAAIGNAVRRQQDTPAHISPQMHESYAALTEHINRQYDFMTRSKDEGGMGISVEVSPEDPYPSMKEARNDVTKNKRLKVLATSTTSQNINQGSNPALTPEVNDRFRAVHDMFGHLAIGRSTDRHGEEAAVQHHAQMFPQQAHAALFSELRGQNSAVVFSGQFPRDKPYDLPDWASKPNPVQPTPERKPEGTQESLFNPGEYPATKRLNTWETLGEQRQFAPLRQQQQNNMEMRYGKG